MKLIVRKGKLPEIYTKRLLLRNIEVEDISKDYIDWLNNPKINKFLELRFQRQTYETVKKFVEQKLRNIDTTKHFGIYELEQDSRLIGTVSVPAVNHIHKFANLSFVIGNTEVSGKGYATEAVHAILYYMFNFCNIEKMEAGFYDGHTSSYRVLRKNGFSIEGRRVKRLIHPDGYRCDHILVGLLKENFVPDTSLLGVLPPICIEV